MIDWISCREAGKRMSLRRDQALDSKQVMGLMMHLGVCRHCRRLNGQMRLLGRAFKSLGKIEEPPPEPPREA